MKAKPKSNSLIIINGHKGYVALHVNQIWEVEKYKDEYMIKHKFLTLYVEEDFFHGMFKEVK